MNYTCPMHPEILQERPGPCPRCGMALEPRAIRREEEADPELTRMIRRFWICLPLTASLLPLSMSGSFGPAQWILATPVVLWGGRPFFERGWASIIRRSPNMFTLIALGTGTAYVYSAAAALFPEIFPGSFRGAGGEVAVYFEAAAVITTLVLLGQVLELRARSQTGSAIKALLGLAPKTARLLLDDGTEQEIPLDRIKSGDRLRIRPGEKIPADGRVLEGTGAIDESLVTGEPIPAQKSPGSRVTGGTLNGTGSLVMQAERVGADTLLAQIVRRVGEAQRSRAPIQRLADAAAFYFVPAVALTAAGTFLLWGLFGPEPRMAYALINAVAVLIIACPCALGLAVPMSILVAVGRGATTGILVKNAEALEILGRVDTLVVDKTGTLTEGKPKLVSVVPAEKGKEQELLRLAGSLEQASEHPLAASIAAGVRSRGVRLAEAAEFRSVTGKGVVGRVEGKAVALGSLRMMEDLGVSISGLSQQADALRKEGQTVIFAAADGKAAGLLGVADPVKSSTPEALEILRSEGVRVIMATGDNPATAAAVAQRLGLEEVWAGVLPDEKGEIVKRLQKEGRVVAAAGDGINDAPALAQADVGIAMGAGADVAMESAGITLVKGDLRGIVRARRLSRATLRNIRQNLFFAFLYNGLGVPLAAGALYPSFGILLNPMIASAAMTFSSVSVIGNALRLRNSRL